MSDLSTQSVKKAVFVFAGSEMGGAERQGLLLAKRLQEDFSVNVQVLGLKADHPGRVADICGEMGVPWQGLSFDWPESICDYLKVVFLLRKRLKLIQPDLLLSYTWLPNVLCALVWRLTGVRQFVWNQRDDGWGLNQSLIHRLAVRLTPQMTSNSCAGREFLLDQYPTINSNITVIHNGIKLQPPRRDRWQWRRDLGIEGNAIVACMVANLHWPKDHETLLKAWLNVQMEVQQIGGEAVLLLAGRFDGAEMSLQSLAQKLQLNSVHFMGSVEDISGLLSATDICVHSSFKEGLPNAILEAMASGLPVIASDIAGNREAVGAAGEPFLVPVGDHKRMAELIVRLINDPEQRQIVGDVMKERVAQEFSIDKMVEKITVLLNLSSCSGEGLITKATFK